MLVSLLIVFLILSSVQCQSFFVSLQGNDANSGSISSPFRTLGRARVAVAAVPRPLTAGVNVWIRAGRYYLDSAFTLEGSADSGSSSHASVTYSAYNGEQVVLIGGTRLLPSLFQNFTNPVSSNIMQINLGQQNITDFGELTPRGMFGCSACISTTTLFPSALEVFQFPPQNTYLARYPGLGEYANTSTVINNGQAFTYFGNEPKSWSSENDIWVHGYWGYSWTDKHLQVSSIDFATSQININPNTQPNFGMHAGDRYYAYNILEELDAPGEYYLNRTSGILYFYPPNQETSTDTYVSMLPYVVQTTNVSYVTFSGVTFAGARGAGVNIFNSSYVSVVQCSFVDFGTVGVNITGGMSNSVQSSNISNTGNGGVFLQGGDRMDLTPSSFSVYNCDISYFNRWVFTYAPGIFINGVGQQVSSNHVHDGPHMGVFLSGNDHLLVGNTLSDLVYETSDAGAFYMGRDWSYRGNYIAKNTFQNINTVLGTGEDKAIALYLDDSGSGFTIVANNFINCSTGIMVGGGRDNTIVNNNFVGTITTMAIKQTAKAKSIRISDGTPYNLGIHFDNRDMNWASSFCEAGGLGPQFLARINYTSSYYAKYPHLQNILQDDPCTPKYNNFTDNIYCQLTQFLDVNETQIEQWGSTYANNDEKC